MHAPLGARVVNCIIGGEPELLVFIPKAGAAIEVHRVLEAPDDWSEQGNQGGEEGDCDDEHTGDTGDEGQPDLEDGARS
eukprot:1558997-Lingulodinium_polyedra.AAC.1